MASIDTLSKLSTEKPIAFFCAEYALDDDATMYAGGLGVLAGDFLLEVADRNIPFVALGLMYGSAVKDNYSVLEKDNAPIIIDILLENEIVHAKVWHRIMAENVHVLLLDTDIAENNEMDRKITARLYDPHFYTRLKQQIVLGIGGVKLLKVLKIFPRVYHLNEGHTAFGGVGLMVERPEDVKKVVGSKHTILSEAGLHVTKKDFETLLGSYCKGHAISVWDLFEKGKYELDHDIFSTTKFLINISQRKNGVSVLHTIFEKKRHADSVLIPITNGVYKKRWQSEKLQGRIKTISDEELMSIKKELRIELFEYVKKVSGKNLNPNICTLVWARRFAAYKRPHLLFSDEKRLINIISSQEFPLQIIISGRAPVGDEEGQAIIRQITTFANNPQTQGRVVYLPDYSIDVTKDLAIGADVWLNTPERGKEACGTSGMKAGLNGALQCSISDGWVDEEKWGERGWILPEENTAEVLYDFLQHEILPCFYGQSLLNNTCTWITKMRSNIELIEKSYTTVRMVDDYLKKLYGF